MDHYLLTARSITHAQQMARALEGAGLPAKLRRAGSSVAGKGCGYTIQIAERHYRRAADALREAGLRPVKTFHVVNGVPREVGV